MRYVNTRRLSSEWDPIYDPTASDFRIGIWSDINSKFFPKKFNTSFREVFNFKNCHTDLSISTDKIAVFEDHHFYECDFNGYMSNYSQLVFKRCTFYKCDFGLSWLHGTKYAECGFSNSSFTQCNMNKAEFRECTWHNTGLSGNETTLNDWYITNPEDFIFSSFEPDKARSSYEAYINNHRFKFFETRYTVARGLFVSLKKLGNEDEFYSAIKSYEVSLGNFRIIDSRYRKELGSTIFCYFQINVLKFFGMLNSWGKNPIRPLSLILINFVCFLIIYWLLLPYEFSFLNSLEKSFNITMLAGYALEMKSNTEDMLRFIQSIQFGLALVFYTSFFSTLVGRISRVK